MLALLPLALSPLAMGCETVFPPLKGEVAIGRDPYGVLVGGEDRASDLYVYDVSRNTVLPLTYTAVAELAPALSPDGVEVALLRAATLKDSLPGTAWVLNLRTGNEHELELPRDAGAPKRLGWATNGQAVFVDAEQGVYRFDAPFGKVKPRLVPAVERATADSSFAVLLGDPVFARVGRCPGGAGVCVVNDHAPPDVLAEDAHDPVRWGPDSVGYFVRDELRVRPLGPGHARHVDWNTPPRRPRAMTYFPGRPMPPEATP